jgi:hypothetical protein
MVHRQQKGMKWQMNTMDLCNKFQQTKENFIEFFYIQSTGQNILWLTL